MITEKYCPRLRHTLPTSEFSSSTTTADGLQPWCRGCQRAYRKVYNARKRAEYSARALDWSKA